MTDIYPKVYKEVYVILQHIPEEELIKVPKDILQTVEKCMDTQYEFQLDENKEFQEQDILKETKALLAVLFKNYWATKEQKERIIAKEKYDIQQMENKKMEMYNPNDIFKKYNKQEVSIVKYKESIFKKIINEIKRFFHIGK